VTEENQAQPASRPPAFDPAGRLRLTLAINDYDHIRDVTSGRVPVEGVALTTLHFEIEEIFHRFLKYREWDVSEISLAKYVALISQGDTSLTAIPVFPSRMFRHSAFYIRRDGTVKAPADLAGKRVGLPEWAQTAAVYGRALMAHEWGVALGEVDWVQAGVNEAGRAEKVALDLPAGVRCRAEPGRSLNDMLRDGSVDAVMSARPPAAFLSGDPAIARLIPDSREAEASYYAKTGIYPIMHTLALRREIVDAHPWVAMNLFKTFEEAKNRALARARDVAASRLPIPWLREHIAAAEALFGADLFPYGLEPNRKTLEAFLAFAQEQGVTRRALAPEDLFPPQVLTRVRV
jgi:4,5-dihydroxyphthalate decarboxylase